MQPAAKGRAAAGAAQWARGRASAGGGRNGRTNLVHAAIAALAQRLGDNKVLHGATLLCHGCCAGRKDTRAAGERSSGRQCRVQQHARIPPPPPAGGHGWTPPPHLFTSQHAAPPVRHSAPVPLCPPRLCIPHHPGALPGHGLFLDTPRSGEHTCVFLLRKRPRRRRACRGRRRLRAGASAPHSRRVCGGAAG